MFGPKIWRSELSNSNNFLFTRREQDTPKENKTAGPNHSQENQKIAGPNRSKNSPCKNKKKKKYKTQDNSSRVTSRQPPYPHGSKPQAITRPSLPKHQPKWGGQPPLLTATLPSRRVWPMLRLLVLSLLQRRILSELLRIGLRIGVVVGIVSQARVIWPHPGGWAREGRP